MEQQKQKSWFGRNWLWVVPVSGCLMLIVLFIFGVGAAVFGISKMVSESEPYEYAFERATTDTTVMEALGTPIEKGFMGSQTNYGYSNGRTTVSLVIPINGPLNEAFIYVEGFKDEEDWEYTKLLVDLKDDENDISLLENTAIEE